jgi:hypothetical protein
MVFPKEEIISGVVSIETIGTAIGNILWVLPKEVDI